MAIRTRDLGDKKHKNQHIIDHLVEHKKYARETAEAIVEDVMDAMKVFRLAKYEEYNHKRIQVELGTFKVDCLVHDVKYTEKDGLMLQVYPLAGEGMRWINPSQIIKVID